MSDSIPSRLLVLGLLLELSSCTTFEVGSNADMTEESINGYQTVHGSLYGIGWGEYQAKKCDAGPLARVEYHYNGLQLVASALSLGIWVPQTVEWWCHDPNAIREDEDEPGLRPEDEFSARDAGGRRS